MQVDIVGAGIVGLAQAWSAAKRGARVRVFERSQHPCGASIRNFGMLWPIGQPAGQWHQVAQHSRQLWQELAQQTGLWLDPCGSMHLAHADDQWQVLQEFAELGPTLGYACQLLEADEVLERLPAANSDQLRGGLFSPSEACVDPRLAPSIISAWLRDIYQVEFFLGLTVTDVSSGQLSTSDGRQWSSDRIIVCAGADLVSLFPRQLAVSGVRRCKLQMLRTESQPGGWRLGMHVASGLTLRHYSNFEICPSLAAYRQRVAVEQPELDHYGIHVMASQNAVGEVVLGDSHEYEERIEPFDKEEIDALILQQLRQLIQLPSWKIQARWHGIYGKLGSGPVFEHEPIPEVHLFCGTGGSGMTMAFGLAEKFWEEKR